MNIDLPLISSEGREEWQKFNRNHRPSMAISDVRAAKGHLLVWRSGTPEEKMLEGGSIIRPDGKTVNYTFPPNCAVIIAVGADSTFKVGDYVFWTYNGYDDKKPQPIVFDFSDKQPTYFLIREENVMATTSHQQEGSRGLN